jgi:hypothetical protein
MGKEKSIVIGGSFEGTSVDIEASTDGVTFQPIWSFTTAASKKVFPVAAKSMRVFVRGRGAEPFYATVNIGANDNGALFAAVPLPAGDGPGAPVDVSPLGNFTTFVIGGPFQGTSVEVQASEDGVDFFPGVIFGDGRAELQSKSVVANFFRTFVRGRNANPFAPIVSVGAIKDAGSGGGGGAGLKNKAGKLIPGNFSGGIKQASVVFTTAYPDTNYTINFDIDSINNKSWAPTYLNKTAAGFTVSLNTGSLANLVEVTWETTAFGES